MKWRPKFSLRTLLIFTLLCTSGVGLWSRWEPAWARAWQFRIDPDEGMDGTGSPPYFVQFSPDGANVIAISESNVERTFDAWTGELLRSRGEAGLVLRPYVFGYDVSRDGRRSLESMMNGYGVLIRDLRTQDELATLDVAKALDASFSPDDQRIVVGILSGEIHVFGRRRPEWWWGVFYLWEFWLTVAFAGLFVWSVWRDRRALGKQEAA